MYRMTLDEAAGRRPYVIVSANARNRGLDSALAAPVTTTDRSHLASAATVPHGECITGHVMCDNIVAVYDDDPRDLAGALSPAAMRQVNEALAAALGLR
ncbi:type II toxin-antitoxin system PemK/MazF family toxin [Demequina sp. NBRC 110056]|uniref:type II toxin-antitoxin system PemK/MazF family toxin n=1 Tax=Demequina sp. NBRC 110056 TaxID=1570345 RepID=UPI0021009A30|nr:type II toxin-antitoxin system PemK/MazF family toxin [Demequina sp. NBRC 110056]